MSSKHPLQDCPNPAEVIFKLAAEASDPAARESLLESARRVDETHRRTVAAFADLQSSIDDSRALLDSIKKQDQLPTWVVILVLSAFLGALTYIAVTQR